MATLLPEIENVLRLTTPPTPGELFLLSQLGERLDDTHEVFFNPFLDGDRPDIIILKKGCGAIIIEVKDWNLTHYQIDKDNKWRYENSLKTSPQQQAFQYKKNFFNLHLPILGLKNVLNRHFFGVIAPYVYFHNATQAELNILYDPSVRDLVTSRNALNRDRQNHTQAAYEEKFERLTRKLDNLNRDLNMSWVRERLPTKIDRFCRLKPSSLFSDEIYEEFKRRLAPSTHVQRQGKPVRFDAKQHALTLSMPGLSKVKGVAGCGKTSILAQRAINARARHEGEVLILTYNISLRHFIRDTISRQQGRGADNGFCVTHFHAFIASSLNELGIDPSDWPDLYQLTPQTMKLLARQLASDPLPRFKTILVDEAQDFDREWIKIIHDIFLDETDGEMVLFADQNQNIYERDGGLREPTSIKGFGQWKRLTRSYRSSIDTRLIQMCKLFQEQHLAQTTPDAELFESAPTQESMRLDILSYESLGTHYDPSNVCRKIREYIKRHGLHPDDVSVICSDVAHLIPINEELLAEEKTKAMFERQHELDELSKRPLTTAERQKKIEIIRRLRKFEFNQHSGLLKLSTTQSFKGHESETVFCILRPGDTAEMVYTGITRAQKNLVVFDSDGSNYESFFKTHMPPPGSAHRL